MTDLIAYLNKGGSVLIMENVMSNLKEESASSFVRLLDAAGLSMALNKSVVNNDPQGYPNRVRQRRADGIWVYERYPVVEGALPYTINSETGEVTWKYQIDNKPDKKPKLEVASWQEEVDGEQVTRLLMKPTTKRLSCWLRRRREFWMRSLGWKSVRILTTTTRSTVWNTVQVRGFRLLVACMFHSIRN